MKFCNLIGQLQGSISRIIMSEGTVQTRSRFAKTMSIEGGAGKAELDWEELELLDTRAVSHCTTGWQCCASNFVES